MDFGTEVDLGIFEWMKGEGRKRGEEGWGSALYRFPSNSKEFKPINPKGNQS